MLTRGCRKTDKMPFPLQFRVVKGKRVGGDCRSGRATHSARVPSEWDCVKTPSMGIIAGAGAYRLLAWKE